MLNRIFIYFIVFSVLGWVYECIYCSIKSGHWENRGFLFGPVCPIYGTGAISVFILAEYAHFMSFESLPLWQIFLIFALGSAVLEYATSWIMEKFFHARWWDYSNLPLNLNGRICLPASILFGVMGILILKYALPFMEIALPAMDTFTGELAALALMAFFSSDVALSMASMGQLLELLEKTQVTIDTRMETRYQAIKQIPTAIEDKKDKAKEELLGQTEAIREKMILDSVDSLKGYHLSRYQRNHLHNIHFFTNHKHRPIAEVLKKRAAKELKVSGDK